MREEKREQSDDVERIHAYQDELVRLGLEEMKHGRVVLHEEVLRRLKVFGRSVDPKANGYVLFV